MALANVRTVLLHRWYFGLVALVVSIGCAVLAGILVPATYEAKTNMLLLPPQLPGNPSGGNPYLNLAGYQPFADVVARAMMSSQNVAELRAHGVTDPYVVARDATTDGPVLIVTVDGSDSAKAMKELGAISANVPSTLTALQVQESIAAIYRFRVQALPTSNHATVVRKTQIRAILVAVVASSFLGIVAIAGGEAMASRRRSRKRRQDVPSAGPTPSNGRSAAFAVAASVPKRAKDQPRQAERPVSERPSPERPAAGEQALSESSSQRTVVRTR